MMSIIVPNPTVDSGSFARASPAHYWGADGLLKLAAIDQPRFQFDLITGYTQLLNEGAATNLISPARDVSSWWRTGVTTLLDAALGPDGLMSADAVIESSAAELHSMAKLSIPVVAGQKYVYSWLVKSAGRNVFVELDSASFDAGTAYFDLTTLAIQPSGATQAMAVDCGNGWVRLVVFATATASGNSYIVNWRLSAAVGDVGSYLGNGMSGIYAFHAQLETDVLTSIIPDTGTRAAEINTATVLSNVPENEYPPWDGGTAYTVGAQVLRKHRIYKRAVAGTTATAPEADTTNWTDMGPSNAWALVDDVIGTRTTAQNNLTTVLRLGLTGGIALMELVGKAAQVTVRDPSTGKVAYQRTVVLDNTQINSIADWFFTPYEQRTDVVLLDLPTQFANAEVTVSIIGSGAVSCGVLKYGRLHKIGSTQYGARAGMMSFVDKKRDAFGRLSIQKRDSSKRCTLSVIVEQKDCDRVHRLLSSLDGVLAIYVGVDTLGYNRLSVYGVLDDFNNDVNFPTCNLFSIEVKGLI